MNSARCRHRVPKGIASVKRNAPTDTRYERKQTKGGFSFNLKATNGQVIGRRGVHHRVRAREGRQRGEERGRGGGGAGGVRGQATLVGQIVR
ncbi:MAG: DUF1508 domain-containing protein [Flavobacteriales bacterium]|nr:DUF1508 domain-containing protein [Flavobacteriales bacterium]